MSNTVTITLSSTVLIMAGLIGLLLSALLNNSLGLISSIAYLAAGMVMLVIEIRSGKQVEYLK
ncbi:MAG: hypothetical protein QXV32_03275 [Conexivisphaerales archaeon]